MDWIEVGRAEDFSLGLHVRTVENTRIVLAVIDGDVCAFSPICPHSGGPLDLAETEGAEIICPLHGWRFDLKRGGCEMHGYRPLSMYGVRVQDGAIYVALPDESVRATSAGVRS